MRSFYAGLVGTFVGVGGASIIFGLLRGILIQSVFGLLCLLFAMIVLFIKGANSKKTRMWCIGLGSFIFSGGVTGIALACIRVEPVVMQQGFVFSIAGVCFLLVALVAWAGKSECKNNGLPS